MQKYTTFSANSKSGRLFFSAGVLIRPAFAPFCEGRQRRPRSGGGMTGGSFVAGGV